MVLVAEYAMSFGFFRRVQYLSFAVGWGYHCVNRAVIVQCWEANLCAGDRASSRLQSCSWNAVMR